MSSATILGLDTPAGAYLARLLGARGYTVAGTASDPERAATMLATLGADGVSISTVPAVADEVYVLDSLPIAGRALSGKVFVALKPGAGSPEVEELRAAGRFAVAGTVFEHACRLDPISSPILALLAAVRDSAPLFVGEDAPIDLGWTPEYVDAMWRMLQQAEPRDHVIASGVGLSKLDIARFGAEWFKVGPLSLPDGPERAPVTGDPSTAARELDWRAFTHGRDLVRTLCEGLPPAGPTAI